VGTIYAFADMLRRHQGEANWPIVSVDYLKKLKVKARDE